jgi:phosphoglycolate phosphatase
VTGASPRAIIFDLDGTLIDSATPITAAVNELRARRGAPALDKSAVKSWISLGAAPLVAKALGDYAVDPVRDLAELRAIYGALRPDPAELFPDVGAALATLRDAGFRMAICTAKPHGLAERVVAGVGLAPFFDALVGGCERLPAKPHPAQAHECLSLLGVDADAAVYVGDSETDAEVALAADLPFFLATFGYAIGDLGAIACQARFDSYRDLPGLIAAHLEGRT